MSVIYKLSRTEIHWGEYYMGTHKLHEAYYHYAPLARFGLIAIANFRRHSCVLCRRKSDTFVKYLLLLLHINPQNNVVHTECIHSSFILRYLTYYRDHCSTLPSRD